jgi:uncharacterized membrane protein
VRTIAKLLLALSLAVNLLLCLLFASEIKKIGSSLFNKKEVIIPPLITAKVYKLNSNKTEELYGRKDTSVALPLPDSCLLS